MHGARFVVDHVPVEAAELELIHEVGQGDSATTTGDSVQRGRVLGEGGRVVGATRGRAGVATVREDVNRARVVDPDQDAGECLSW